VSFAAITICVASQRVFIVVGAYFVMTDSENFWMHPRMRRHVTRHTWRSVTSPTNFCIRIYRLRRTFLTLYKSPPVVVPFIGIIAANSCTNELHVDSTNENCKLHCVMTPSFSSTAIENRWKLASVIFILAFFNVV
jgi:hypothetical protein